mgnify:CR=1 FL=1
MSKQDADTWNLANRCADDYSIGNLRSRFKAWLAEDRCRPELRRERLTTIALAIMLAEHRGAK